MCKERFLISPPPHLGNQVTKSTIGVPPRKCVKHLKGNCKILSRKEAHYGLE